MSELYDYLITAYKVIAGLISTKRLIIAAIIAFGIYLVWVSLALTFSFQRKFAKNCNKLISFVKQNQNNMTPATMRTIDDMVENISSGFCNGWKKFKKSKNKKPSDCIQRRDSLDVEVTGGANNQGKTFMKAFITFTTIVLFLFNFAHLGNNETITFYLIAETMVLPIVYYCVMLVFYILYTSIKQQLYKQDIECFYELVGLLDEACSGDEADEISVTKIERPVVESQPVVAFNDFETQPVVEEPVEVPQTETVAQLEPEVQEEPIKPQTEEPFLEKPIMAEKVEEEVEEQPNNHFEEDTTRELFDLLAELESNNGVVGQGIYEESEPAKNEQSQAKQNDFEEVQTTENAPAINLEAFEVGDTEAKEESLQDLSAVATNDYNVDELIDEVFADIEENQAPVEETEEENSNALEEYDVFKKKNIDVDKFVNEIPGEYNANLPFINVDSDYVIKDEYSVSNHTNFDNANSGESYIDVSKNVARFDRDKLAELAGDSKQENLQSAEIEEEQSVENAEDEQVVAENEETSQLNEAEEIAENNDAEPFVIQEASEFNEDTESDGDNEQHQTDSSETENEQTEIAEEQVDTEESINSEEIAENNEVSETIENADEDKGVEETDANGEQTLEESEPVEEEKQNDEESDDTDEELSDEHRQNIAQAISGLRANMYASENDEEFAEPISRREKPFGYESPTERYDEFDAEPISRRGGVTHLNVNDSAESIIGSVRSTSGGFDTDYQQNLYNAQNYDNPGYYAPYEQYQNDGFDGSFAKMFEQNANPYNSQNVINDMFNESFGGFDEEREKPEKSSKKSTAKKSSKKTKSDDESENFNFEKEVIDAMSDEQKKRGRPKKQVIDESVIIKNDEEFNEILSRAEKLMRKSEEGLSASQSKRIEKELKVLMDAMNRYKENEEK